MTEDEKRDFLLGMISLLDFDKWAAVFQVDLDSLKFQRSVMQFVITWKKSVPDEKSNWRP